MTINMKLKDVLILRKEIMNQDQFSLQGQKQKHIRRNKGYFFQDLLQGQYRHVVLRVNPSHPE